MRKLSAAVLVLTIAASGACARLHIGNTKKTSEMDAALRDAVKGAGTPAYVTRDTEGAKLWKLTRQFYVNRDFAPAWIKDAQPRPQMDAFIQAIANASSEGLDPELYSYSLLQQKRHEAGKGFLTKKGFDPKEAGAMDVWLTYLYMKYSSDLANGLSDLAHADPSWKIKPDPFDPLQNLERALANNEVAESLSALTPSHPAYQALRKTLAEYRDKAAHGGWPAVPAATKLKPGQRSPLVPALAKRLAATGDYSGAIPPDGQPAVYGPDLQEAVKRFQRRHGLTDDGLVAAPTVAEMNVPIQERIREIELNMERWRWLPHDLGERHVIVNVPEMRLDVVDHGQVALTMRVVVGKKDTPTPIFDDDMTTVIFSPYWNVPTDIAQNETLPEVLKDPGFLQRANMEVIDQSGNAVDPASIDLSEPGRYRFRQKPGTNNSLGLVKFMFPNQFNVYLHDTPADSLFARASRSFSHGCVRVQEPEKLAEYVLRDQPEWTPERISEAMHAGVERSVKLRTPIPVYIAYFTANVSEDGLVQFRKDVYGVDLTQTARLNDRLQRLRSTASASAAAIAEPRRKAQRQRRSR